MSKKEKNMNNVEEKDIKKADNEAADTTTDANAANTDNKDADTVETQGSSDADVKKGTRKQIDKMCAEVEVISGQKAYWFKMDENGELAGGIAKFLQEKKDAVIEDLNDRLKRQMAEFDNYRKRTDKEKSAMFEMGASDVIKKLLPIVDNFERGFKSVTEEELQTPFAKGMDMVYKQTMKMLEDLQVKPIEALGSEFNPDFHNAVMHVEDDSQGENIIVEEFEKGYTYRDVVIRHSMVKVAN